MTYDELKALIEQRGVHPAVGPVGAGHDIQQNPHELATFLVAMQAPGVQSVLEIGTGPQAGLARFMHEVMGWNVTSVDINTPYYQDAAIAFHLITPPSRATFDRRFDLVIIDGDHRYENVKADHEHYRQYADMVVMFHDITGDRGCEGARDYWREIAYGRGPSEFSDQRESPRWGYYEAIADGDERAGIGWYDVVIEQAYPLPALAISEPEPIIPDGYEDTGKTIEVDFEPVPVVKPKKRGRKSGVKSA